MLDEPEDLQVGKPYNLMSEGLVHCRVIVVDLLEDEDYVRVRFPDGHLENVLPEELEEV